MVSMIEKKEVSKGRYVEAEEGQDNMQQPVRTTWRNGQCTFSLLFYRFIEVVLTVYVCAM